MESDNIESVEPEYNLNHLMIKKELCNESENVILDEVCNFFFNSIRK